jgi:hypothetical protein
MLSFRFKALIVNDFNTTTRTQQTHNNFHFVVLQPQQISLLLCPCCICNLLKI